MNAIGTESLSTTKEWESSTIEGFLDAAIRWAEDSDFGQAAGSRRESVEAICCLPVLREDL
jgi:hypothetical protein